MRNHAENSDCNVLTMLPSDKWSQIKDGKIILKLIGTITWN